MKVNGKIALVAANSTAEEPILESIWHAVAGSPITAEYLEWPADLFALTDVLLERSEAYRFVLSPPNNQEWPPSRFSSWSNAVEEAGRQWSMWVEDRATPFPELLMEEWSIFRERVGMTLEQLAEGHDWRMFEALLTLHAIADEACAGLGMALDRSDGKGCVYRARSYWQKPDRWLESNHTSCAYCPRCARLPTERRCARFPATPAFEVPAWRHAGTRCLPVATVPALGPGTPTCCCYPGRCECASPISAHWTIRWKGWAKSPSVFFSSHLRRSSIWIS